MFSANILLDQERIKNNISRRKLAKGICSPQLLIKATTDDANIELLTFKILLERLGRSPEYLEYILSEKEYQKILTQNNIENAIYSRDFTLARNLLDQYIPNPSTASPVLTMYYNRTQAWILFDEGNYHSAKEYIIKAITTTLPNISITNYRQYLISSYEYENIMMLARILFLSGSTELATQIVHSIYNHAVNTISDKLLLASILPKSVYLMGTYCTNTINNDQLINYLEAAIELLRDEGIIYMLEPLISILTSLYDNKHLYNKASSFYTYRDTIKDLNRKYIPDIPQDSLFFRFRRASYNLDTEILKAERKAKDVSQSNLADGIFSESCSLSRLETKKQSPNKNTFNKLMDRLNLRMSRRSGFVLTESFERLDFFLKLRASATKLNYEEIEALIEKNAPYSEYEMQIVNAARCVAITASNLLNRTATATAKHDLSANIEEFINSQCYNRKPFTEEAYVIVSYLLIDNNTFLNSQNIFECVFNSLRTSSILPKYSYSSYCTIIINYLSSCGKQLPADKIDTLCDLCIQCSLSSGNGSSLPGIFWGKVRSLHKRVAPNFYNCKNAYLFASLYKGKDAEYIKSFYDYYFPLPNE